VKSLGPGPLTLNPALTKTVQPIGLRKISRHELASDDVRE